MGFRDSEVFSLRIEQDQLAKNMVCIGKIFGYMADSGISCECISINIDWMAIVIRRSERELLPHFMEALHDYLPEAEMKVEDDFTLIAVDGIRFNGQMIGTLMNLLIFRGIDIRLMRLTNRNSKFLLGVPTPQKEHAKGILREHLYRPN